MASNNRKTVLIIGATGVFGRRLVAHLTERERGFNGIELVVAGRRLNPAQALAKSLDSVAMPIRAVALTHGPDQDIASQLAAIRPWAVIDCSGPFQNQDYLLVSAVIAQGAHWIDLADARRYLLGFEAAMDRAARRAGMTAVAGASSTPALSGAVIMEITKDWVARHTVNIA
ncbi:MAG: saccharopine dehydrogenase NADP-binding domain-containing protein, partial [Pseudomonadota bacterium]